MIAPNKIIPLDDSALGHCPLILRHGPRPIDLVALYHKVADHFESIDQFLVTLDVLFVLRRIDIDPDTRRISYAS